MWGFKPETNDLTYVKFTVNFFSTDFLTDAFSNEHFLQEFDLVIGDSRRRSIQHWTIKFVFCEKKITTKQSETEISLPKNKSTYTIFGEVALEVIHPSYQSFSQKKNLFSALTKPRG